MASESFFDNTAFFHTTYGTLILTPEIRLFSCFSTQVSSFPLGFFLGMHISTPSGLCPMKPVSCQSLIPLGSRRGSSSQIFLSWTWPLYVELNHTIRRLLVHNRLFFMLWVFFTTIACRLPVFIQRTLNRSLGSVQQDFFAPLKNVYQTFGVTVRQFTKRFQCTPENLRKKVNPSIGLGLGHLKLNSMEFLKGIDLQIYQYEEHFVLNQRQHCCKIYVGALYLPR